MNILTTVEEALARDTDRRFNGDSENGREPESYDSIAKSIQMDTAMLTGLMAKYQTADSLPKLHQALCEQILGREEAGESLSEIAESLQIPTDLIRQNHNVHKRTVGVKAEASTSYHRVGSSVQKTEEPNWIVNTRPNPNDPVGKEWNSYWDNAYDESRIRRRNQ